MRLRLGPPDSLLDSPRFWAVAWRHPWLFAAEWLHRAGLHALHAREFAPAVRLFEAAALRYRDDLRPELLARVRVHQLMARACAAGGHLSPLSLEVDRALTRLDRIETPAPPFEVVPAHVLLASWLEGTPAEDSLERLAA